MTILIYRVRGRVTASMYSTTLVAEVEVDEMPSNLRRFAKQHGGDFAEVQYNSPILEELATA